MGSLVRLLLILAGSVFVVLGLVGMFVPLLPTTVFLLLAAWCYARSSDRFLEWLLGNRLFGEYIRNYRDGLGLRVREKAVTLGVLWVTIGYSLLFLDLRSWVMLLLAAVAAGVTTHILMLKTYRPERRPREAAFPDRTSPRGEEPGSA